MDFDLVKTFLLTSRDTLKSITFQWHWYSTTNSTLESTLPLLATPNLRHLTFPGFETTSEKVKMVSLCTSLDSLRSPYWTALAAEQLLAVARASPPTLRRLIIDDKNVRSLADFENMFVTLQRVVRLSMMVGLARLGSWWRRRQKTWRARRGRLFWTRAPKRRS